MRIRLAPVALVAATLAAVLTSAAAPASAAPASAGTGRCVPTDRSGAPIELAVADNGRTVCLLPGQHLNVTLVVDVSIHPNPANWWRPIGASGTALTQLPLPAPPPAGVTQASFKTTGVGSSLVTSYRDFCPPGIPCGAPLMLWRVTAQAYAG